MRSLLLLLLLSILPRYYSAAQEKADAVLYFPQGLTHDFGEIPEGPNGTHDFEFVNRGGSPLIIQKAQSSCGCVSTGWPKEPILPGKKGRIRVNYATQGRPGAFVKTVYVVSNARNDQSSIGPGLQLTIKGVVKKADAETPDNPMMKNTD